MFLQLVVAIQCTAASCLNIKWTNTNNQFTCSQAVYLSLINLFIDLVV